MADDLFERHNQPVDCVMTIAPMRISFAGGGTDIPDIYQRIGGATLSTTINKHVFVTVKRLSELFGVGYRLNYSQTEHVNSVDEIENDIIRECLKLVPVEPPLYVATVADIPASTGLGSSGSFAVALLAALYHLQGHNVAKSTLAEQAAAVEIEALGRNTGKQDQYAAAFGGLSLLRYSHDGQVDRVVPTPSQHSQEHFFDHILMFWTGKTRDASTILTAQSKRSVENIDALAAMREQACLMADLVEGVPDMQKIGEMLHEAWELKKSLEQTITDPQIDEWYAMARASGAYGGKVCGAGGGGFLMFVAPLDRHKEIVNALPLKRMEFEYEPNGVQILFPN